MSFDPREFMRSQTPDNDTPDADIRPAAPQPGPVAQVSEPEAPAPQENTQTTPVVAQAQPVVADSVEELEVPAPPTAPADVAQAAAADPVPDFDEDDEDDEDDVNDPAVYRRRRLVAVAGVLAFAVAVGLAVTVGPLAPHRSPAALSAKEKSTKVLTQDATLDINTIAAGDQKRAVAMLTSQGSLDGFTITATDVRVAASGRAAVISRVHAGACYMYGILDANPTAVQVDPTSAACTDAEIAKAQKALDEQTIALEQVEAESAQTAFTAASDTVMYYAAKNFDANGVPTLTGLPTDLGNGVRVVANHGSYVTTQATINGVCKSAELGADGTLGQIVNCR